MTRVKICGVTRPEDARAAADAGVWAIGLMFIPQSPRRLSARQALAVTDALPKGVLRVGVFMDQSLEEIRRLEAEIPLDLIQLHGREPKELCLEVGRERCLRAVVLDGASSVDAALEYPCEFLLIDRPLDAASQPLQSSYPQRKESVHWELAKRLVGRKAKTLLADRLNPQNVADAVRAVNPWGVDVSSGLEASAGVKDHKLIGAFMKAVRAADGGAS